MYVSVMVYLVYPLWAWLYVDQFQYGVEGLGMSRLTCEFLQYGITYFIFVNFYKKKFRKSWFPYNVDALKHRRSFLRIGLPVGTITFTAFAFWEF